MILVNNKKSNILLKAVALMVACVFFADTITYAAPSYSNATNLAPELRLRPFLAKNGLEFVNQFAVATAAAQLRDINSTRGIRKIKDLSMMPFS